MSTPSAGYKITRTMRDVVETVYLLVCKLAIPATTLVDGHYYLYLPTTPETTTFDIEVNDASYLPSTHTVED